VERVKSQIEWRSRLSLDSKVIWTKCKSEGRGKRSSESKEKTIAKNLKRAVETSHARGRSKFLAWREQKRIIKNDRLIELRRAEKEGREEQEKSGD